MERLVEEIIEKLEKVTTEIDSSTEYRIPQASFPKVDKELKKIILEVEAMANELSDEASRNKLKSLTAPLSVLVGMKNDGYRPMLVKGENYIKLIVPLQSYLKIKRMK